MIFACLGDVSVYLLLAPPSPANVDCKQVLRDLRERGRDIEGCIKQWFEYVKPNFHKYVEPQRNVAGESILSLTNSVSTCGRFRDDPKHKHSSTEFY